MDSAAVSGRASGRMAAFTAHTIYRIPGIDIRTMSERQSLICLAASLADQRAGFRALRYY
jgi:hypothetical protein